MPALYTLTVTRRSRLAFRGRDVEIYIDGQFRGKLGNGSQRQFQLAQDEVSLYVRDMHRINIVPLASPPLLITSGEAKEFDFQVEYGMSDLAYFSALVLGTAGLFSGIYYQPAYLILLFLCILYFAGYRFLDKDHYLYIEKVMKTQDGMNPS